MVLLFLDLYLPPPPPSPPPPRPLTPVFVTPSATPSFTHIFVTHHLCHTTFHIQLCHTPSLSHHLSHTTLSHTIFVTPSLPHTIFVIPSFTHIFVSDNLSPHHLSHTKTTLSQTTIFHTHLCLRQSFTTPSYTHTHTHIFVTHTHTRTHHLSQTSLSQQSFTAALLRGRRGTSDTGLGLVTRLVPVGRPIHRRFTWQA